PGEPSAVPAALYGKAVILVHCGRLGDAHRTITAGIDFAKENSNATWLDYLHSALMTLRWRTGDFGGVRELWREYGTTGVCNPHTRLSMGVCMGFAELAALEYGTARRYFSEVRDYPTHPKTVMQWRWRMYARLGLTETWLAEENLSRASVEADALAIAVAAFGDPMMKSLAWELKARLAMVSRAQKKAEEYVARGLDIVNAVDVPLAAWQVQTAAWAVYRKSQPKRAEAHRSKAQTAILQLAASLTGIESLQQSLLASPRVCRILE